MKGDNTIDIQVINPKKAPSPIGAYSQVIISEKLVFISGQIAINPETNQFIDGTVEEQLEQVLKNIETMLYESNSQFENILKVNIYTTDLNKFPVINAIYGKRFNNYYPVRSCVEVSKLPLNAKIEIDVIARIK